ncbi:MAG: H(+)-transporting ATPase [Oscillospiraceae bacterium]|nr:H(+)-transporting ATPase [Oscillospiraceae bacterium]
MRNFFQKLSPARIVALGFAFLILLGSLLLSLPCSVRDGVETTYADMLYTSTSAVCVTGLITLDPADTFTPIGQTILGVLMQLGGLGVTVVGAGIILAVGQKVDLKGRSVIRDSMNLTSSGSAVRFVKRVFLTTLTFELIGAVLSFFVFVKDFPLPRAIGISLFHSVAAFNNSGFDILGGFQSLTNYYDNVALNLITAALIILGGIGFLLIREVIEKKFRWKRFSMHTKVVLCFSGILIVLGTLLLKLTDDITWLGAFFSSVSARTAGFATKPMGSLTGAGLLVMIVLMFIGASPGSTGGGVKTTTLFVLITGIRSAATNRAEKAFKYSVPSDAFRKAAVIVMMGIGIVLTGTFLILVFEPELSFIDALFEITSAFGTAGLSTGITGSLSLASKLLCIVIMYIGRLGPMTIATLWYFSKGERIRYPEGNISIG